MVFEGKLSQQCDNLAHKKSLLVLLFHLLLFQQEVVSSSVNCSQCSILIDASPDDTRRVEWVDAKGKKP